MKVSGLSCRRPLGKARGGGGGGFPGGPGVEGVGPHLQGATGRRGTSAAGGQADGLPGEAAAADGDGGGVHGGCGKGQGWEQGAKRCGGRDGRRRK